MQWHAMNNVYSKSTAPLSADSAAAACVITVQTERWRHSTALLAALR